MKWIDRLNLAEEYLRLPISKYLNEKQAKERLKNIRELFNIII